MINNAKALERSLKAEGVRLVSGGTDNHLLLLDLGSDGLTGKEVEQLLDRANITVNKNSVPNETRKPAVTSGIRAVSYTHLDVYKRQVRSGYAGEPHKRWPGDYTSGQQKDILSEENSMNRDITVSSIETGPYCVNTYFVRLNNSDECVIIDPADAGKVNTYLEKRCV